MSRDGSRRAFWVFVLLLVLACRGDSGADDALAQQFLSRVANRDTSALELVAPNGEIAKAGWSGIAPLVDAVTSSGAPRLVALAMGNDGQSSYRKLTYRFSGDSTRVIEIWLENDDNRRVISTIRSSRL
jgi:hypothetical protein